MRDVRQKLRKALCSGKIHNLPITCTKKILFFYRYFIHHKTLIDRNYLILKRMAEEIASYPAQARVGILSPKIKPVPKTSTEHVERIETATEKYLIGTVTEIKKVLRLDYPILEINLWQGNPVKIMSFYLHLLLELSKIIFLSILTLNS